jgi:hypothetical protein
MAGMTALERMAKGRREEEAESRAIIARAEEIAAGAPLKFGEDDMRKALKAFVEFKECARRFWGDPRDYLQKNGVDTVFGTPTCQSCRSTFSDGKAWAKHMMSYRHFLDANRASHESVMELRAHLHAFPAPKEAFDSFDYYKLEKAYSFRNLQGENEGPVEGVAEDKAKVSEAVDGPWRAYLEVDRAGNACIYLQEGYDRRNRELHETVEFDIRASIPEQEKAYLREAEDEARERNRA